MLTFIQLRGLFWTSCCQGVRPVKSIKPGNLGQFRWILAGRYRYRQNHALLLDNWFHHYWWKCVPDYARWSGKMEDRKWDLQNTLKNQGYNFGDNYGLGKNNLSTVFVLLMMLAFLVDQTLQLCCPLFNEVWKKEKSKKQLWEDIRSLFRFFNFDSMESLYRAILYDLNVDLPNMSTR